MQLSPSNLSAERAITPTEAAVPSVQDAPGSSRQHNALIVLFAFLAHGLLLLNDGVYWDGWRLYHWLRDKNWEALHWHFTDSNAPLIIPLHRLMGYFPNIVFGYKLTVFVSLMLSALLVYRIGSESGFLSRAEALCVALFALIFPAYRTTVEWITMPYSLCYALYLGGVYLAFRAERAQAGRHWGLRLCALLCFVASFSTSSLLVFHFGFLWLLAAYLRKQKGLSWGQTFKGDLLRRTDYVLLPFLYWGLSKVLIRTAENPLWQGYNRPSLSIRTLVYFVKGLWASVYIQFDELLAQVVRQPLVWLLCLLTAHWLYGVWREERLPFAAPAARSKTVLAFGAGLLGLGLFPYVAVGKSPSSAGWDTRHALLVALPVAILVVGAMRLLFVDTQGRLSRPGAMLIATLLCGGLLSTFQMYIGWQARWVKDRSIMVNLRRLPGAERYSIYEINDQFPVGEETHYDIWEWAGIFKAAWGSESRVGLDKYSYMYPQAQEMQTNAYLYDKHLMLSEFNPNGSRASLRIQPGSEDSPASLCLHYFSHRFFRRGELDTFLSGVTRLEVEPAKPAIPTSANAPAENH